MTSRRSRWLAWAALPVVLAVAPVATHAAQRVDCAKALSAAPWQRFDTPLPISSFAVDGRSPNRVFVTDGDTIARSDNYGCSWVTVLDLDAVGGDGGVSSVTSQITAMTVTSTGAAVATVAEGSGAQARPHILRSASGSRGTWALADSGLPLTGRPQHVAAGGAGVVVIGLALPAAAGDEPGPVPLPPLGGGGPAEGLESVVYYSTNDAGSWVAGATPADVGGSRSVSRVAVDTFDGKLVYVVAAGRLYRSVTNGRTVTASSGLGGSVTAVAVAGARAVHAFGPGFGATSANAGVSFRSTRLDGTVTSAAHRLSDGRALVSRSSGLAFYDVQSGRLTATRPPGFGSGPVATDVSSEPTFYAVSGSRLYRYYDPVPLRPPPPPRPGADSGTVPPPQGSISPARSHLDLPRNGHQTVTYTLSLPRSPTPVDIYYLIDVTPSMHDLITDLKANAAMAARQLRTAGIDAQFGVASVGSVPNSYTNQPPDPPETPANPGYRQPRLYERLRTIGPVDTALFQAIAKLRVEPPPNSGSGCGSLSGRQGPPENRCTDPRLEGQLLALRQLVVGDGARSGIVTVPAGQQAGFRQRVGVRRMVVLATDEPFANPEGSPRMANGRLDYPGVTRLLRDNDVRVLGVANDAPGARVDLERVARLTGALAPAGGLDCDGDGRIGEYDVRPSGPIVCEQGNNFSALVPRVVSALTDTQDVQLALSRTSPVLRSLSASLLRGIDVTRANRLTFTATYSCVGLKADTYAVNVDAVLRGYRVASTVTTVSCGARPLPPVRPAPAPPLPEAAVQPPPPPPVPAVPQPAPNPQPNPQPQVQVQPGSALATQEQEQLQLALATIGILPDDAVQAEGVKTLPMAPRHQDERAAMAVLATGMAGCAASGLVVLRRRKQVAADAIRPVWNSLRR